MRENAAVHGGADKHRRSAVTLLPMAIVAAVVLALALFVSNGRTGTIVFARMVVSATTTQSGRTSHTALFSILEITETSPDGVEQRVLTSDTFTRPGFQMVVAGQRIELYDPLDDTIFATTQAAEQRAVNAQTGLSQAGITARVQYARISFVPGRRSVFQQQLLAHQYRVAARETIDGRPALKLVPVTANQLLPARHSPGSYASLGTAYVSPRTYDPIEEVNRTRLSGIVSTAIVRWRSYRVLPATSANQRLLSLTARHPHARMIDNARAFLRATQSEQRPSRSLGLKKGQTLATAASGRSCAAER